jgi:hypothetical protein
MGFWLAKLRLALAAVLPSDDSESRINKLAVNGVK